MPTASSPVARRLGCSYEQLLWTPGIGIGPLGWLWLLLAVLIDLGNWGSTGYANRNRYVPPTRLRQGMPPAHLRWCSPCYRALLLEEDSRFQG